MPKHLTVRVVKNDIEKAMRIFKKKLMADHFFSTIKNSQIAETKSQKKKRKDRAAQTRRAKKSNTIPVNEYGEAFQRNDNRIVLMNRESDDL